MNTSPSLPPKPNSDTTKPINDETAFEYAKALEQWARNRWGVKTERVWRCPLSDGSHVYQIDYYSDGGYCPDDGRKLVLVTVESQEQPYRRKLEDFISLPEYPEPPKEDV